MSETNLDLHAEIQKAIEKDLPNQVGEAMKKQLQRLEFLEKKDVESEATILQKGKEIESLKLKIDGLEKVVAETEELRKREETILQKERDKKVWEAELKLAESEKRVTDAINFVGMALKSPIYRTVVQESSHGWHQYNGSESRGGMTDAKTTVTTTVPDGEPLPPNP